MATTRTGMSTAYPLAAIRFSIGASALLAPRAVAGLLRLDADAAYPIRVWGARNVLLTRATLDPDASVRTAALKGGIAIDALDLASGLVTARQAPALLRVGMPVLAGALGAATLRRERRG